MTVRNNTANNSNASINHLQRHEYQQKYLISNKITKAPPPSSSTEYSQQQDTLMNISRHNALLKLPRKDSGSPLNLGISMVPAQDRTEKSATRLSLCQEDAVFMQNAFSDTQSANKEEKPHWTAVPAPSSMLRKRIRGRRPSPRSTFPCHACDRFYSRKDDLKAHQRVHTGEMPFKCEHCGKLFRWQSALHAHRDSPHCNSNSKNDCPLPLSESAHCFDSNDLSTAFLSDVFSMDTEQSQKETFREEVQPGKTEYNAHSNLSMDMGHYPHSSTHDRWSSSEGYTNCTGYNSTTPTVQLVINREIIYILIECGQDVCRTAIPLTRTHGNEEDAADDNKWAVIAHLFSRPSKYHLLRTMCLQHG